MLIIERKWLTYSLTENEGIMDGLILVNFNSPFSIPGFEKVEMILDVEGGFVIGKVTD